MTRTRWLGFGIALLLAVVTAMGLGAWRANRNDPGPSVTLRPGETIEFRGSEFALESFGQYQMPADVDLAEVPQGAVFVQLVLTQTVITAPAEPYDLSCRLLLVNQGNTWQVDLSLGYRLKLNSKCHENADGQTLAAGEVNTVSGVWAVPPAALDSARVEVQFSSPRGAFEVRPAG